MILVDKVTNITTIKNEKMGFAIKHDGHLVLHQVIHGAIPQRAELSAEEAELFTMELEGGHILPCSKWHITVIESGGDQTEELVSVSLSIQCGQDQLLAKVIFLHHLEDQSIRYLIQLGANWDEWGPKEVYLHMPFLANLRLDEEQPNHYYFPSNPQAKRDGSSIMQMHVEFTMPLGIFHPNQQHGFSLEFPNLNEHWFIWVQNRNMELKQMTSLVELQHHRLLLRPDPVPADVMEIKFSAIERGWVEFFNSWRQNARKPISFKEYERPELKWYKDTFLQHFTYIFSKEVYDFEKNQIDVERLLQQGEAFGGYDSLLLWHQYPRLGVDGRNQWEFFGEFPGGMPGLKNTVEQFHQRGVKVFLPFKPWDIGFDESVKQSTLSIVEIVRETNIDGVFLDTMDSVPDSFRDAVHDIKPDFVFCSEGRPKKKHQIEIITGSWNQFKNKESMPETDIFRYVMTEHFSPIISRWHVGIRKDLLIKRAIFNGTGILIWQDVFGSWLPYNKLQQEAIKKWKHIWREHKANYQGSSPIPLYPMLQSGLYCNAFPSDDGKSVIYSVFNDTSEEIHGDLLKCANSEITAVVELWDNLPVQVVQLDGYDLLRGTVKSKQLSIIKVSL
ncbi:hypothetical protein [Paenibacillus aceris]|uniref:Uncharacterized protein n=1 Tax=Paenibacillus aceris TaxID=869555 RepID=A0ABS4I798_9BACL|nr:hypothetical protein [Paenibacillus aceris]MBP1966796.1 hypothetical protein [Paenibacillus aceris]NHW39423.1 hypothetical protein [Paenibacillus aceris]